MHKLTTTTVYQLTGTTPVLLHHVNARKMTYFSHILHQLKDSVEHAAVSGLTEGSRIRGRPRRSWINNIFQWSICCADRGCLRQREVD